MVSIPQVIGIGTGMFIAFYLMTYVVTWIIGRLHKWDF